MKSDNPGFFGGGVNTVVVMLSAAIMAFLSGCSTLSNIVFTPHPRSLVEPNCKSGNCNVTFVEDYDKCNLTLKQTGTEKVVSERDKLLGLSCTEILNKIRAAPKAGEGKPENLGLGVGADVLVEVAKGILDAESKQHFDSYSGSSQRRDLNIGYLKAIKMNSRNLSEFHAGFKPEGIVFQMERPSLKITGLKSKVSVSPWVTLAHLENPFENHALFNIIGLINPVMMLHAIYGIFDDDIYKKDVKADISFDIFQTSRDKDKIVSTAIGKIQFHNRKISIFDVQEDTASTIDALEGGASSEYRVNPAAGSLLEYPEVLIPANVTISIIESDDFGDVIGKAGKLVGDNSKSIKDWFK